MIKTNDTIVAPATNISTQAIALIRISGDDALKITNQLVKKKVEEKRGFYLRKIFDQAKLVDEVVITFYNAPNSFTGEEVVEIACHGGILNTNRIINLIIKNGARMALKGEFSQRAFLNNKIDLIQAEGINDLIHASNELALKIGVDNMSKRHNEAIKTLKESLLDLISRIQVSIDYPDYDDIEGSTPKELIMLLKQIISRVEKIILGSKIVTKAVEGIKTVIVGETNVGKSSLLNALINENKAIVTDIPGTTRDIVEGQINLGNVTINLIDTAGIRKTTDVVENLGISKAKNLIDEADLVLYVINANNYDNQENEAIFKAVKKKTHIVVLNKAKEVNDKELQKIRDDFKQNELVLVNAINQDLEELVNKISLMYDNEKILKNDDLLLININQISLLEKVLQSAKKALDNLENDFPIDIVNVDLYDAWNALNELIGEEYDEEVIDNIFRKYCLGK